MERADIDLRAREAAKSSAVEAIEEAISSVEGAGRQPDAWERVCLIQSIADMFYGLYELAEAEAEDALTPPSNRSPKPHLPSDAPYDSCNLALLKRALRHARAEEVKRFPSFGPVVFADPAQSKS